MVMLNKGRNNEIRFYFFTMSKYLITAGASLVGLSALAPLAMAEELSTSTINTVITDQIANVKSVAGDNLPTIFGLAVLIALAFVAFSWFRRLVGVRRR
jgi:hypothetical protein